MRADRAQELCGWHPQSVGQPHDDVKGGVPPSTFDPADVGPVHSDIVGEPLLRPRPLPGRPLGVHPQVAHAQTELRPMIVALHEDSIA